MSQEFEEGGSSYPFLWEMARQAEETMSWKNPDQDNTQSSKHGDWFQGENKNVNKIQSNKTESVLLNFI